LITIEFGIKVLDLGGSMLEEQRHRLILDLLDEHTFASVPEMSAQLKASEATIRRDIVKLANKDLIKKIRGGAEALRSGVQSSKRPHIKGSAFLVDKEQKADSKRAIAKKAVELCADGESIIINGGSSTFMMGEFLVERDLKILTNSFFLAQELGTKSENLITLPGGELYPKQGIILSAFENDTIQYYHATKMFMGTPGIGEYGVMESDPVLIRAEQKLRKQADTLVILADSSKIGSRSNFIFSPLEQVDILITDNMVSDSSVSMFEAAGVEVIVAEE
jgi:DeoR family ulaG and ulaABCDEF operon transcriptional repressor